MEEQNSRISRKIADGPLDEVWISKFYLDYAHGQLLLLREARHLCIIAVTGGNLTSYYRFLKGFYGLADIRIIFQEKTDQTLNNKHPAWLDYINVVTKSLNDEHEKELIDVLTKLEKAGYSLNGTKSEFLKTEVKWLCNKIDQGVIRPPQDKVTARKY